MFRILSIPVFILLIVFSQVMIGWAKEDGSKCLKYDRRNRNCIRCPPKHYKSRENCLPCIDNCNECSSDQDCSKCEIGYFFSS